MTKDNNVVTVLSDNVISYDSGAKIFQHDPERGKWSSRWDFFAACLSHSFGVINFSIIPLILILNCGVLFIIPYTIGILVFTIPVFFIQSFLGQFSSTGFISAFRLAPMFKGIGYVILCLNLFNTCYLSVYTAIPLFYFFASFGTSLPWMSCINPWNTMFCAEFINKTTEFNKTTFGNLDNLPTSEYFNQIIAARDQSHWYISWRLLLITLLIWIMLAGVLTSGVETIGRFLRCFITIILIIVLIIVLRLFCLPDAFESIFVFLSDFGQLLSQFEFAFGVPFLATLAFGTGWGSILTLASYNNFKYDIGKMSVVVCFCHLVLVVIGALTAFIITEHLTKTYNSVWPTNSVDFIYAVYPFFFGTLAAGHLWTIMFFAMLFLAEFSSCVVQLLSVLTAIFDEFEKLRKFRKEVTLGLISCLALFSIGYTSKNGIGLILTEQGLTQAFQMVVCFIEVMVVVWVYGRLRFQRDVQFMLSKTYPTWRFFMIRFVTPIFILSALFANFLHFIYSVFLFSESQVQLLIITIIIKVIPLIIIPIYIVVRLSATTGTFLNRFRRLCKPTDWHPVDPIHRQKYEDFLANSDITHQLVNFNVESDDMQQ